jgi:hypothetical protein
MNDCQYWYYKPIHEGHMSNACILQKDYVPCQVIFFSLWLDSNPQKSNKITYKQNVLLLLCTIYELGLYIKFEYILQYVAQI